MVDFTVQLKFCRPNPGGLNEVRKHNPQRNQCYRICNRSLRYADAYAKGMNGREAAYATKLYRSHRSIPNDYLRDLKNRGPLRSSENYVDSNGSVPTGMFCFQRPQYCSENYCTISFNSSAL
ncbi:hypothetical protein B0H14DRAFT_2367298 [Mycena olivaceomarginata]|nr:hypothetical protein B0H14DRAFT_2367298 [Mycena olivaceomarginata]